MSAGGRLANALAGVKVEEVKVAGKSVAFTAPSDRSPLQVAIIPGSSCEVEVRFTTVLQELDGLVGFDFTIPPTSDSQLSLVGLERIQIDRAPDATIAKLEGNRVLASLGAATDVRLRWRESSLAPTVSATAKVTLLHLLQMDRLLQAGELLVQVKWADANRDAHRLVLELPPNLVPRRVEGLGLKNWDWSAPASTGAATRLILGGTKTGQHGVANLSLVGVVTAGRRLNVVANAKPMETGDVAWRIALLPGWQCGDLNVPPGKSRPDARRRVARVAAARWRRGRVH